MDKAKFKQDSIIIFLAGLQAQHNLGQITLIGGAVIDILDGRKPKDYDLDINSDTKLEKILVDMGYMFMGETNTARTFKKGSVTIQFLKTSSINFDFTISQAKYSIKTTELKIDELSYNTKKLTPCHFTNKQHVLNSLYRLPHWIKKGYRVENATYFSMLNALNNKLDDSVQVYRTS